MINYSFSRKLKTNHIYGLQDPRTGEFRYVGKSTDPAYRLVGHMKKFDRDRKAWVEAMGEPPHVVVLETLVPNGDEEFLDFAGQIDRRETYWKRTLTSLGERLMDRERHELDVTPGDEDLAKLRAIPHLEEGERSWATRAAAWRKFAAREDTHALHDKDD